MQDQPRFRVSRSGVFQIHQAMRDEILRALELLLFGTVQDGYAIRHELERSFAQMMHQSHAVAVHSATMGLFLVLRACQIGAGDEVITVGNSDISTTAAICLCGATPVLCDVLESDFTINPQLVESLITSRTRALIPVDLHGHPANVRQLRQLADHYKLTIVEDAALATGAYDHGKPVGAYADVTVFSFAPLKPLGSVGNGAMVVTNDPDINEQLRLLTYYGHAADGSGILPGHQHYVDQGYNVPLDPLQAALLSVKHPHLPEFTAKRQAIAQTYYAGLVNTAAIRPAFRPESGPTFRSYTIRVKRQQVIYQQLRASGVEVVLHYTPPIYRHPVYDGQLTCATELPVTDRLAGELLCLPVAPELTENDIAYVVSLLRNLLD
ncbi:MAG: DegT/DnrJ/EryC1/StrS family aminotransferase [Anaerolineae bacterium]|nr:DegT/DnrJ/EryC1/StrS family aminotransferase [Anaerolineae bacterium]